MYNTEARKDSYDDETISDAETLSTGALALTVHVPQRTLRNALAGNWKQVRLAFNFA